MFWWWIEADGVPSGWPASKIFEKLTDPNLSSVVQVFGYSAMSYQAPYFIDWQLLEWVAEGLKEHDMHSKMRGRFVSKQLNEHGAQMSEVEACRIIDSLK